MGAVAEPLHTNWLAIGSTRGDALTVIVKVDGVPAQPAKLGVTVIVPLIGSAVGLVAMNDPMLPVPDAARPIAVLLFVHA